MPGEAFRVHGTDPRTHRAEPIVDVVVGIDIIDEQKISILGPNSKESNKEIRIRGDCIISAEFDSTPLSPGRYTVTVGIFSDNLSMAYDLVEHTTTFKILGETRHGKVYIEPRWSIANTAT